MIPLSVRTQAVTTLIMAVALSTVAEQAGTLRLSNMDTLSGKLAGIDSNLELTWNHALVNDALMIPAANVRDITFDRATIPEAERKGERVTLKNGDQFSGSLSAIDGKFAYIKTDYASGIRIARTALAALHFHTVPQGLVYEGPNSLDEWIVAASQWDRPWTFSKGVLKTTFPISIGRQVNLPKRCSIEFAFASVTIPALQVNFFTDTVNSMNGIAYYVLMSPGQVNLGCRIPKPDGLAMSNGKPLRFSGAPAGRVRILSNQDTREIFFLVDDVLVERWKAPGPFIPRGGGIVFHPQSRGGFSLSDIRITSWDGQIPDPPAKETVSTSDVIRFLNGDRVNGTITSVREGNVLFETSARALSAPVARVASIHFARRQEPSPARREGLARAHLLDGSRITLSITTLGDEKLDGSVAGSGPLSIRSAYLKRLELNVDEGGPQSP